jgi:G6PDH family F420-dependent oxidoreductase
MATTGDIGPGVTAPTFRWHPAMVAQASATLEAMFPGRHWLGIGSGEALNEHIVAPYWPEAPERINRMFEAIEIITKLFEGSLAGKDVKYSGTWYRLESTRLWTMPPTPPPIYVATAGPVTARRAGVHADGLITVGAPVEKIARLFAPSDPDVHRAALQRYADLGFDAIYLHNVGRTQREWIEVFGRDVLPALVA